jgi:hypothetical protein
MYHGRKEDASGLIRERWFVRRILELLAIATFDFTISPAAGIPLPAV